MFPLSALPGSGPMLFSSPLGAFPSARQTVFFGLSAATHVRYVERVTRVAHVILCAWLAGTKARPFTAVYLAS